MSEEKHYRNKEWIESQYIEKKRSMRNISRECKVSDCNIKY